MRGKHFDAPTEQSKNNYDRLFNENILKSFQNKKRNVHLQDPLFKSFLRLPVFNLIQLKLVFAQLENNSPAHKNSLKTMFLFFQAS
jgi:hypothetical protein